MGSTLNAKIASDQIESVMEIRNIDLQQFYQTLLRRVTRLLFVFLE